MEDVMGLPPDLTTVQNLARIPEYSYGWVPKKYRQEATMPNTSKQKTKPTLDPFLKVIRSKPYSDMIDKICDIVIETVTDGCFTLHAYSYKTVNHDLIIIGTMEDVINWCRANKIDLNQPWLSTSLCRPANNLADIIAEDILGEKLVNWVAETAKKAMPLVNPPASISEILDVSLYRIVEKYLCNGIVWATAPLIDNGVSHHLLAKHISEVWFRNWVTSNNITKPTWASEPKTMTPPTQNKPAPIGEAQVHRIQRYEQDHTTIEYVGTISLVNGTDIITLEQTIRKTYGPGEYRVQICKDDPLRPGIIRVVEMINVKVLATPLQAKKAPKKEILQRTHEKPAPKIEDEKDLFAAAIRGGLFKKDIEEP